MRDLVKPGEGPLVDEGSLHTGIDLTGPWTLELAFRLGASKRTRIIAHTGTPGARQFWCAGLRDHHPFIEVTSDGASRHWLGSPLSEGLHLLRVSGQHADVLQVELDGTRHDVQSAGRILPDELGPFPSSDSLQLGGLRDLAGGHADLRFGLDDGDDLLAARLHEAAVMERPLELSTRMVEERAELQHREGSDPACTKVFGSGEGGYAGFRIPGLLTLPSGRILAVAEGRLESLSDSCPTKDLVLKYSDDGGESWSPLHVVVRGADVGDGRSGSAMNPCLLHDAQLGSNRTLLVFTALQGTEWEAASGQAMGVLQLVSSDDAGESWSVPQPLLPPGARAPDLEAFGPPIEDRQPSLQVPSLGHGVQVRQGPAAGRMLICGNTTYPGQSVFSSVLHTYESDDAGRTWRFGPSVTLDEAGLPALGLNEVSIALLDGDTIMLSVRGYENDVPSGERTLVSGRFAQDGSLQWGLARRRSRLFAPAVHGSIAACPHETQPDCIALCHPSHPTERRDLDVITMSRAGRMLGRRRVRTGFAAYSDIAHDPTTDTILVLFEHSLEGELAFARIPTPRTMEVTE